nr:hypothetical protein [Tanacetum cinerariifolium]
MSKKWLRVDDSVDIVDEIRTIARANQRFDESCELAARRALEELDPSLTPAVWIEPTQPFNVLNILLRAIPILSSTIRPVISYCEEDKTRIVEHGLPKKMSGLGNYVLRFYVNGTTQMSALADIGASVSVLPYSLYKNLGLIDPRPYNSKLTMSDNTQAKAKRIDDGVICHTYFPKPRAKAYLEIFEIDKEDDWLSCFEVGRDEDGNPKGDCQGVKELVFWGVNIVWSVVGLGKTLNSGGTLFTDGKVVSWVPSYIGRPNLQTTIETQHDFDGLVDQNIPNRGKRQQLPSKYLVTPSMTQPPTTMVPKQRASKNKNKGKKANISPVNLGHMNSWMELMIRRRPLNANWTVSYTSTISVHPENNKFIILRDPHVIGTLDGSARPYPSWNDVDWVFLPIHVAGNHWATGVIHLANSHFYVYDSMSSRKNNNVISQLIKCWTPVLNHILEERSYFNQTRGPHDFQYSYNDGLDIYVPQQTNMLDCRVITYWLIYSLCSQRKPIVQGSSQQFFENFRNEMCTHFYRSRCEDTRNCGYD